MRHVLRGQRIAYVRVSSVDQNPQRQLDQAQVDKLLTDKVSGKDTQRPQLDALLSFARFVHQGAARIDLFDRVVNEGLDFFCRRRALGQSAHLRAW